MGPVKGQTTYDLVRLSDVVASVRLETGQTDRVDLGDPPGSWSYTIYDFTVLESVKGVLRAAGHVKVARVGGRGSWERDFPRPGLGEEFVVFLKWFPTANAYRHLYGPETFRIVNGEVQPMSRHYRSLTGRRIADVLRDLRRRVKDSG